MKKYISLVMALFLIAPIVSAGGVGIKWSQESTLVPEKTKTCLTYNLYNPFEGDAYAQIKLSDELMGIVSSWESDTQFIPEFTSSDDAIPVTFCFKTPVVYEKDCLIGDSLLCKQECNEGMKSFSGEVEVISVSNEAQLEQGGSATQLSASAPLNVRVRCIEHSRNYSPIYLLVAAIALVLLIISFYKSKKEEGESVLKKEDSKKNKKPFEKKDFSKKNIVKGGASKKKASRKKSKKK